MLAWDRQIRLPGGDASARVGAGAGVVRVLAGTAFVRAGEPEEALETLGAGTNTDNLEACAPSALSRLDLRSCD